MSIRRTRWDVTERIVTSLFLAAILTVAITAYSLPIPGRCLEVVLAAGLTGAFVQWVAPRPTGFGVSIICVLAFRFAVHTYANPDQHRWLVTAQIGSLLSVALLFPGMARVLHQARAERERTTPRP